MFRAIALAAALALPHAAPAQTTGEVHFSAGDFGTMVSGQVTGQDCVD